MQFTHKNKINSISNFNILQWNVRSLTARLPSLQYLLANQKYSIAILSETWLLPSRSTKIPHFRTFRCDRPDGYGGVAIAIHNSFKSKLKPIDMTTKNSLIRFKIDLIGIEISKTDLPFPLKVWSCYIPSSSNVPSNLWLILFKLVTQNSLLCGDFNAFHPPGVPF